MIDFLGINIQSDLKETSIFGLKITSLKME